MIKIYSLVIALSCIFLSTFKAKSLDERGDSLQINKNSLNYKSIGKNVSLFPLDNFSSFINNDPETDKEIGKAIGAFGELERSGNFTNTINPNELTEFPIGLRENVSNVEYGIVVTKAQFTPEYALINVYARVVTPQAGAEGGRRTLYFGAEGVKLSYGGKIIGDAKLSLLGDINIPFNQNQWMLTLEGGMINKFNGQSINDKTYVVIDCDGIKELSLKGNVQISRNVLVPVDSNGTLLPEIGNDGFTNRVRGNFALKASDWNDILVNVSITPFAITSQIKNQDKGFFSFYVNNAVLDLSDLRTDSNVLFPQYYATHGYLIGGTETWRGLYVESLYVGLPQEFKTEDHIDNRVSFQAQNLLIDSYGVSGSFSANNLFPLEKGLTSEQNSWRYSLDQIGVDLAASKIIGANLKGKVQLPVQKQNNANPNNNLPNHLGYQGVITEEEYMITVATLDEISFDIWSAKATIAPGSYLELKVKNREFLPKAVLTGTLAIGANGSPTDNNSDPNAKKDADFKGIQFRELTLQTKAPYVTAQYFGVQGEQKLVGFPASIKNIFVEADNGYANLGFEITVGLQEERFSATGGMKINGLIVNENNRQRWKYNGFNLTKLGLRNVDIGVAIVSGEFQIMRNDPLYGDGFTAHLNAKLKQLNIEVNVNAAYGFSTFRYWGFEGSVDGLKIQASALTITGFTGGAFYRMVPNRDMSLDPAYKDKALVLTPDNSVGLALRAGIYGSIASKNAISIMAGFNMSTNPNGGLANVGFIGEALVMADLSKLIPGDPLAGVKDKFKEMTGNNKFINDLKNNSHVNSFLDTQVVDDQYPITKDVKGAIYAKLAMNYDFNNSVFHASLDVFVNIANGIISGIGPNGRAGWAVVHIAPSEWYMHIGTPTDMIGLKVGFGNFSLQSGSYFMVGNRIPGSPPPPPEVAQILGLQLSDIDYMSSLNALGDGKGFAFGTHLKFDTGDMNALFLYARFQAGLGTDIMLKDYGDAKCSNRGGDQIGINGWYANGQAYVYLQGELGIKIKLWFIRKKIPIIKAGVASLLQAKGPNPYWVRGYLGGYYNLLGGMIKGRFRFKMEFGEECVLENASVLGGMKIITDLTPKKDDTNVDVFAIPQATFAMRVNEPIVIPEDDGDHTYKIVVEKMTIIDDQGKEIKGVIEYANSKDVANFVSDDILPPSKTLKAIAQVSFMEKKNGMYEVVMVDGQKAIEVEERTFTTRTAPNVIPLSNIKYAYPVVEQENYYIQESNNGYIKLKRGQDYLFDDPNWTTKAVFAADSQTESNFSYDENDNIVKFNVPNLNKQKDYTLALIAKNKNAGQTDGNTNSGQSGNILNSTGGVDNNTSNPDANTNEDSSVTTTTETKTAQNLSKDGEIDRLSFVFRTSKYNKMSDKLSSLNFNPLWIKLSSDVIMLQNNMNADEYFDVAELTGTKYTDNKPLINLTALMDDSFAGKFKGLFYDAYPINQLTLDRAENEEDFAGIPPVKAFPVFTSYLQYLGSDKGNGFLKQTFPYKYDLFSFYKSDWYELLSKAASKYVGTPMNARPQAINNLLQSTYGTIPTTKYKVKAKYVLPGDKAGSEKQIDYEFK
ncbi:hypothetical protein QWT87_11355 [Chryseobacterium sp. APV1]|uniref:Uncharacterized protein n=1 Tax=Chryseobacterium urinae TaxID=3058400 RepID=A0ABT8U352_9FLAO|nr:hypothetical protein [Chryseobacterium sp. APV1]MDO3425488.1 hypothetical protein [Chryseobacterium sp. APV1]